ncbi:MAG: hypothetical protein WAM60_19670 [Candidatus Promineifilaceae bacterium]
MTYRFQSKTAVILIGFLGCLALLSLSCVIPVGPAIGGPQPVPPSGVPASALLLSAEPFPSGWGVAPCDLDCDLEGDKEALRYFGIDGRPGHVLQEVYYYGSVESAHTVFESDVNSSLSTATPIARAPFVPFQPPNEITYSSPIADEQYLGCGVDVTPTCVAERRYGQYIVSFYIIVDGGNGEGLKIEDIEPILRAIDIQVSKLLNIPMKNSE